MSIFNKTNEGRIKKALELLDLIDVSVASNKASAEDVARLLKPLTDRLGVSPAAAPEPAPRGSAMRAPRWADVREMAEKADLKDLGTAIAVFLNRFDMALYDAEQKNERN